MSSAVLGQTFISGLFLGGIYSLVAIGLTLIYGVMGIMNFAHGEFLMIGMYITYWAFALLGIDPYLSFPLVILIMFIFGVLIQRGLFSHVLKAIVMNQILLTMGLSSFLVGFAQFSWGAQPRNMILSYSSSGFQVGDVVINHTRLIALVVATGISLLLYLFLSKHKLGKAIRASSQSRRAASLMGIDVDKIYMIVMGISAALTGVAGVLMAPSYPVTPTIGANFSLTAYVIVVLGSMGNFLGAFIGGIIIGLAEAFGGLILGSELRQVTSLLIFIVILLFKPEGLFGRKA